MFTLDEMVSAALLMTDQELREARKLLEKIESAPPSARRKVAADTDHNKALRRMAEAGIPLTVPVPEPEGPEPDFGRMTEAAQRAELTYHGVPVRETTPSGRLREGGYDTSKNGQPLHVEVTGDDTVQLATDLYALVPHDYNGSPSVDAVRLENIIRGLHSGRALTGEEWDVLHDLEARYADQLAAFVARGRDGQDARLPEGTGRVTPAELPLGEASAASSAGALERGEPDDIAPHDVVAQLDQVVPDDHPDREAIDRLKRRGAALDGGERDEVAALGVKHRDLLDGFGADLAPLSEAQALQALADVGGVPMRLGTRVPVRSAPVGTPADLLREAGVSIKDGA